jgi:hypothetical protein
VDATLLRTPPAELDAAGNALFEVSHSFALAPDGVQLGTVLKLLLSRYTVDEVLAVAQQMPFDAELAERLRYTRGLTVVDFSSRIEAQRRQAHDDVNQRVNLLKNIVFDMDAVSGYNELLGEVNARLTSEGYMPTTTSELTEALR